MVVEVAVDPNPVVPVLLAAAAPMVQTEHVVVGAVLLIEVTLSVAGVAVIWAQMVVVAAEVEVAI